MPPIPTPAPVGQTVTFDDAVRIATERSPDAARAAQAILRAEAILQGARGIFLPTVNGTVTTTILNEERGFQGQVTQPQSQAAFGAQVAYPILAASRWAQATQAGDQAAIARISRDETRRQIALAVSDAYLDVINQHRQVSVNTRALENGRDHLAFASARLQAGAGSRLNELRAAQEASSDEVLLEATLLLLRRAQEALGVLLVADGPVDTAGEPIFEVPGELPSTWLSGRVDIRLADAEVAAADRVRRDSWKDWVPAGSRQLRAGVPHAGRHLAAVGHVGGGRPVRHPDLRRGSAALAGPAARRRAGADAHRSHRPRARDPRRRADRARCRPDHRAGAGRGPPRGGSGERGRAHHRRGLPRRRDDQPRGDRRAAPGSRRRDRRRHR